MTLINLKKLAVIGDKALRKRLGRPKNKAKTMKKNRHFFVETL